MSEIEDKKNYYVYLHIRNDNGLPFYVGMGKNNRCFVRSKGSRSDWWFKTVSKYGYDVIFLSKNITKDEAKECEKYWIKRIGRKNTGKGILINMTDGGDGSLGKKLKKSHIEKLRRINTGRIVSKETGKRISESKKGRPTWNKGKKWPEEVIHKLKKSHKGQVAWNKGIKTGKEKIETRIKKSLSKSYGKHHRAKIVLDVHTGIFHLCVRDACFTCGLSRSGLTRQIRLGNKKRFIYV